MTNLELLKCFELAITSPYGIMRSINGATSPHKGTDVAVYVKAAGDGKVVAVRNSVPNSHTGLSVRGQELGNYVYIAHDDGYMSMYCHLGASSIRVTVGQAVKKGQIIGILGNTGQSSNAHTHIQFEKDGAHINPLNVPMLKAPTDTPVMAAKGEYIVKAGDSLWGIAHAQLKDGSRYKELAALNGITNNFIMAGQVIRLP